MAIPKKQKSSQDDWLKAIREIEEIVPRRDLDNLVDRTVEEIKSFTKNKRVAFGWSGGKDSLVLAKVMHHAKIDQCVLVISNLEYPDFLKWATDQMPWELTVITTGQDLPWLSQNQKMLFPQDAQTAAKWFHIVQHAGQRKYFQEFKLDLLALGRRKAPARQYPEGRSGSRLQELTAVGALWPAGFHLCALLS